VALSALVWHRLWQPHKQRLELPNQLGLCVCKHALLHSQMFVCSQLVRDAGIHCGPLAQLLLQ
jgi:hypothetical protein